MTGSNSNNVKDWIIRIELLTPYMVWIWRAFNDFLYLKIILLNKIMGEIYKIRNIKNEKLYIGQTTIGHEKRFRNHINNALKYNKNGCPILEAAIRKHGADSFEIELLETCNIEELNDLEAYYIDAFDCVIPNGYNLMTGGGNGRKHSQLTKERMTKTRTGKKHSQITRERMSEAQRGKKVSNSTKKLWSQIRKKQTTPNYPDEIKNSMEELNLAFLPMYLYFCWDRRTSQHHLKIFVDHPNKPYRQFSSKKISLTKRIKTAIEYLNTN